MSLETLPFLAALVGALVVAWAWDGVVQARMLSWLAAGMIVGLPVVYGLTVAPSDWLAPACDRFAAAHLGAGMIGAAGCLALAGATHWLPTRAHRVAAAVAVALLAIAFVAAAYPACLHSPFAGVDPLVRALWLDHVVESLPLPAFLRTRPMVGTAIVAPLALGLGGSVAAIATLKGLAARRYALVALLAATGLALAFWQVRVLATAAPFGLIGGVHLVERLRRRLIVGRLPLAARLAPVAILAFGSTTWALALRGDPARPGAAAKAACLAPEALAPLATLPPGRAVAPMDSGAFLLEATRLDVFAAPYHRNDDGNRFAFDTWLAPPERAAALLAARHVRYVVVCPGTSETTRLAARAPAGLAATLASGHVPGFLTAVALSGTPYRVYAVTPAP